jgi:hypothetical protein
MIARLLIEHVVTDNCASGQPWPPCLMNGWVLVRAVDGDRTLWRRISLFVEQIDWVELLRRDSK